MAREEKAVFTNMCMVTDGRGNVLVQDRLNPDWPGITFPGGHVEPEESFTQSVVREVFEETGLIAEEVQLFGVFSGPELHYIYPNGDEVSNIDIVFLCRSFSGTLKPQEDEVEDLRFFPIDAIPENLSPPIRPALEKWVHMKRANITKW